MLNSMHKYIPQLVISKYLRRKCETAIFTKDFLVCAFISVTSYQNTEMIQLKVQHNLYAKAFQDKELE